VYSLSSSDFHDVTSGSNGYSAGKGYDLVTGLGTPLANKVVADLVGPASSSSSSAAKPATTATTASVRALVSGMDSIGGPLQLQAVAQTLASSEQPTSVAIDAGGDAAHAVPLAATSIGLGGASASARSAALKVFAAGDALVDMPADSLAWELGLRAGDRVASAPAETLAGSTAGSAEFAGSEELCGGAGATMLDWSHIGRQAFSPSAARDIQATDECFAAGEFESFAGNVAATAPRAAAVPSAADAWAASDKLLLAAVAGLAGYWQVAGPSARVGREDERFAASA
ncbi:MAG TPA: hypothetical protein VG433_16685, partial [Pirellulales bacterium]|nr:hypothetical protein [Pirellulales bacterium]